MIFHIIGPSGSGKTTLGTKLAKLKNVQIIDTDKIDDPNAVEIIEKYHFKTKANVNAFIRQLGVANGSAVQRILKDYKKLDPKLNHIVFVGFCHVGMAKLEKLIDYGYLIDVDPAILWRQYNRRTAACIASNYAKIIQLLNSNFAEEKIHCLFSKKFGIRNGFDCAGPMDLTREIKSAKAHAKQLGYKCMHADAIYKDIKKQVA